MVKDEDFSTLPTRERMEKQKQAKNKQKGNIILIGELFKHKLLKSTVVHLYIDILLDDTEQPDDNDIALLCHLMGSVGKMLDSEGDAKDGDVKRRFSRGNPKIEGNPKIDGYIAKMKILANNKTALSIRYRCLVKDIIELRERKWVRRIEKTVDPRKISEIRDVFGKKIRNKASRMPYRQEKQRHSQNAPRSHILNKKPSLRSFSVPNSPNRVRRQCTSRKTSKLMRSPPSAPRRSRKDILTPPRKLSYNGNGSHSINLSNQATNNSEKYQVWESRRLNHDIKGASQN